MTPELAQAVRLLEAGELIGLPTETVYGLAADATQPRAVASIFALKGRPKAHPLILHLADASWLGEYCRGVPDDAWALAREFWPGPLSMVLLRKTGRVPDEVTGGLETVAVRVPAHPIALSVLRALGRPLAAPSANRFGAISPTTRQHVEQDFGREVKLVLEGGPCDIGLESTIIDLTSAEPRLLRPGGVTRRELEGVLGRKVRDDDGSGARAPGTLASHYAPNARVELMGSEQGLHERAAELENAADKTGILLGRGRFRQSGAFLVEDLSAGEGLFAHELYAALRRLDAAACAVILVLPPPSFGLGEAILDRMQRAAAPKRSAR